MVESIKFYGMPYLFPNGTVVSKLSRCNLFFGRNASGKSSITRFIDKKYSDKYDVEIFNKGKRYVSKNHKLEALVLGKDNATIDNKLSKYDGDVKNYHEQKHIIKDDYDTFNHDYTIVKDQLDNWYKHNAKHLKDVNVSKMNKAGFKTALKRSIYNKDNPQKLSVNQIERYKDVVNEPSKKNLNTKIILPEIDLTDIYKNLTKISNISNKYLKLKNLPGINSDKGVSFAIQGVRIHNSGDRCAFCGNPISGKRYAQLKKFIPEYLAFKDVIQSTLGYVNNYLLILENYTSDVKKTNFYLNFSDQAENLINRIRSAFKSYKKLFNNIKSFLLNKQLNVGLSFKKYEYNIPNNLTFKHLQNAADVLYNKNKNFQVERRNTKSKCAKKLVNNYLNEQKNSSQFTSLISELKSIQYKLKGKSNKLHNINNELNNLHDKESKNLKGTKSEEVVAHRINVYLSRLGDKSFKLKCVKGHNGQYYSVIDDDDNPRSIDSLSSGELNLISFLYFYYSIIADNEASKVPKHKIIIFDDPMDSNDADFQYLMIDMLQELINRINNKKNKLRYTSYQNNQLFIFTHNVHFYLNIIYGIGYKKLRVYHLNKCGDHTCVDYIKKKSYDYENDYQELWAAVVFLYRKNKAAFMLNPIRRIIETFTEFEGLDKNNFYEKCKGSKKKLNVNSHAIDDINVDSFDHSCDEVINEMRDLFKSNDCLDHFNRYWKRFNDRYNSVMKSNNK